MRNSECGIARLALIPHSAFGIPHCKRPRHVRQPCLGCQRRLRGGVPRPDQQVHHRPSPAATQGARETLALVVAAGPEARARTPPATRRTAGNPRTAARAARNGGTTARERGASGGGTRRTPAGRNRGTRGGRGTTGTRLGGGAARRPHAPRARLTAARITSSGAASSAKKRLNAAAP